MFNQVHTKKMNRLSTKKLNSLVYVMYNRKLKHKHMNVKSVGDIDPLEINEVPSDDEWLVGDDEGHEAEGEWNSNVPPMTDEEFEHLMNNVLKTNKGISKGRGPCGRGGGSKKKSTNEKGKGKKGKNLIDEEETEWEDEEGDEEEEFEDDDTMESDDD